MGSACGPREAPEGSAAKPRRRARASGSGKGKRQRQTFKGKGQREVQRRLLSSFPLNFYLLPSYAVICRSNARVRKPPSPAGHAERRRAGPLAGVRQPAPRRGIRCRHPVRAAAAAVCASTPALHSGLGGRLVPYRPGDAAHCARLQQSVGCTRRCRAVAVFWHLHRDALSLERRPLPPDRVRSISKCWGWRACGSWARRSCSA